MKPDIALHLAPYEPKMYSNLPTIMIYFLVIYPASVPFYYRYLKYIKKE